MKKRIAMLLCALCALVSAATLPALAAEQHYPVSVEEYTYGPLDELRINKVYQLSLTDSPSGIPTEDFERNGRHYYLLDMIRQDEVGVDTQAHTETITMDSDTGDLAEVLKRLDAQMEVATEDGYTGTLLLDHTSVKVEVKGYQTRNPKAHHGKQTVKQLVEQGAGVQNIEITDKNIKSFERVARKYGVDYALKKDPENGKYLVFFKARDADALNAAFAEYTAQTLKRGQQKRPSVRDRLSHFKEVVKNMVRETARDRDRGGYER